MSKVQFKEPFAKLETALYEVPALEDASIFPNSMAKAIDEGISRYNLVPPQIESVYSFAKGSKVSSFWIYESLDTLKIQEEYFFLHFRQKIIAFFP